MPQALIEINAVAGSNDDLPLNTLVQLSNADTGGELTYLWEIVDQPAGTADVLSSSAIENPTFTPKKEGTYLLRLTVNLALSNEKVATAIAAIRSLKTYERIPAATETTEDDAALGWKVAANSLLTRLDSTLADANLVVCRLPGASVPTLGQVVTVGRLDSQIKVGLPGQEVIPACATALATAAANVAGLLGVVVGSPTSIGANGYAIVRVLGISEIELDTGPATVGDYVYVSDVGIPSLTSGTASRIVGRVSYASGVTWRWMIDGQYQAAGSHGDVTVCSYMALSVIGVNTTFQAVVGYLETTGAGLSYQREIPLLVGDRLKSFTFSLYGDGVADLTTDVIQFFNDGTAAAVLATLDSNNHAASWSDITIPIGPTTIDGTFAVVVQGTGHATGLRIKNFRWTYDRP